MMKILVLLGLIFMVGCTQPAQVQNDPDPPDMMDDNMDKTAEASMDKAMDDSMDKGTDDMKTVVFTVTGEDYKFLMDGKEAPELRVKQGDKVRIEFTSTQGFHDWVVDEFNAATEQVMSGNGDASTTIVEFVADKKGTYEYYCSVGKHREAGMIGNLVVE